MKLLFVSIIFGFEGLFVGNCIFAYSLLKVSDIFIVFCGIAGFLAPSCIVIFDKIYGKLKKKPIGEKLEDIG